MVEILIFVQHFLDTLWSDNDGAAVDSLKTQWEPSAADFKSIRPNQWYLQPQTVLNDLGLETPLILPRKPIAVGFRQVKGRSPICFIIDGPQSTYFYFT